MNIYLLCSFKLQPDIWASLYLLWELNIMNSHLDTAGRNQETQLCNETFLLHCVRMFLNLIIKECITEQMEKNKHRFLKHLFTK